MKILVTGAGGFLGSRLATALLAGAPGLPAVSTLVAVDTAVGGIDDPRVQWRTGTITDGASRSRWSRTVSTSCTTSRRS